MGGPPAWGLPDVTERGVAWLEAVRTGGETLEPAWFLIEVKMDFAADEALNFGMAVMLGVLGDILVCLDLGLGWVMKLVDVVVLLAELVTVLVAGNSVGGAREICVFPAGGWLG